MAFFFAPGPNGVFDGHKNQDQEVQGGQARKAQGRPKEGGQKPTLLMAVYCYIADDGEPLEIERPMGKAPKSLRRSGKKFLRDYARELRGSPQNRWGGGNHWRGEPLLSENFGGLPRQAKEFEKAMAMRGVPTKFCERTGKAVFESRAHRNRAMKSRNMYDQDAGYGDYSGDIVKEAPMDISAIFEGVE